MHLGCSSQGPPFYVLPVGRLRSGFQIPPAIASLALIVEDDAAGGTNTADGLTESAVSIVVAVIVGADVVVVLGLDIVVCAWLVVVLGSVVVVVVVEVVVLVVVVVEVVVLVAVVASLVAVVATGRATVGSGVMVATELARTVVRLPPVVEVAASTELWAPSPKPRTRTAATATAARATATAENTRGIPEKRRLPPGRSRCRQ